jgi:uncharacterized protein (DUF1697 family)
MRYAAFLRGINVGGRQVASSKLKAVFASAGFTGVSTVLASGNVRFESPETSRGQLIATAGAALRKELGYEVIVQLRTLDELRSIVAADPFRDVAVTPETRLYVSFYSEKPRGGLRVPYAAENGELRILQQTAGEVYGVVTLSPRTGTTDYMALLDREYGRTVTTRNWNTLLKLAGN